MFLSIKLAGAQRGMTTQRPRVLGMNLRIPLKEITGWMVYWAHSISHIQPTAARMNPKAEGDSLKGTSGHSISHSPRKAQRPLAEVLEGHLCASCGQRRLGASFSRKMLTRPPAKRRCAECVGQKAKREGSPWDGLRCGWTKSCTTWTP